ncbi:MAG TPA: hypothetical protein IAB34_08250 [Candidatus Egerieimonas faecigallinarum]|nr:hypothetical protein [Candidatus Egerieimonas faecigallinarum]
MQNDELFRTSFFGGYNKEDVLKYIQAVENNIQSIKNSYQKEIEELKKENERLKSLLQEEGKEELIQEEQNSSEEELRYQLDKVQEELKQYKSVGINTEKSHQLEMEIQTLTEKKEQYEEEYHAITKVLEDARISAKKIEEDAQKRAEEILSEAQKESQALKERLKSQIDKDLEDKGIRLMAAKYKIEAYRKEINSTQQKLYNLYSDMGKMVDNMPQRLEQLWDGDAYSDLLSQDGETGKSEDNNTALDTAGEIR